MSTRIIGNLKLSLLGFKVVTDVVFIKGIPFEFEYKGSKLRITDMKLRTSKEVSTQHVLDAYLKDAG